MRWKRIVSGIMTAVMLAGVLPTPYAGAKENPVNPPMNPPALTDDADLLMRLTFDEDGAGTGSYGADIGGKVTEHGNIQYVEGADGTKALSITEYAAGNYLELPKGILAGRSAATFTFQIKTFSTGNTGWAFMTTPLPINQGQSYNGGEKFLAVGGVNANRIMAERHYNSARKSILSIQDDFSVWRNVAVVYETGGTKVYVDGELTSFDTHQIDIGQLLTEEANTWIGHGNWGSGEGFLGMLDDFRIYGRALKGEEISQIAKSKEIISSNSNCLLMETDFSQNGAKVLSALVGETVSVKTRITNYSKTERTLVYYLTGYGVDGSVTEQAQQIGGEVKAESMETIAFTKDVTAKAGAQYYQLLVKDVTDASRIQEFSAGYLSTGEALTAQMIAGTYQRDDGSRMIVSVSDVKGTQVTVNGKTFTAALENGALKLTDSQGAYAVKQNASATDGMLTVEVLVEPKKIEKSVGGNPITGTDKDGTRMYCGDPAAVVIGDKVYLVVGHDNGIPGNNNGNYYNIPDWQYYTSTDLKTWKHEGLFMKQSDIPWRTTSNDAWASQMTPYTNKKTGETKYYFYFCTPSNRTTHAIGVAVADQPGGPYTATSAPLIKGADTWVEGIGNAGHHDIDPTVWIDTDEDGTEHRYLMWGNTTCYIAELNEDMVSIKDRNGDGKITIDHTGSGDHDVKYINFANVQPNQGFTEGPWLYRRQDENGKYYGKYYMFAAWGWAEKLGYATADDPFGSWTFQDMIMENTLTSNTNHPSVIDFKGKTYLIYHNGALPGGNGGNRSVCIQEMTFHEDGSIDLMPDLSLGIGGTASVIRTSDNQYLGHDPLGDTQEFVVGANGGGQGVYQMDVKSYEKESAYDTQWEIVPAREVPEGENADYYVSIQSTNLTGYFIKSESRNTKLASDNMGTMGAMMSYKTVKALDGSNGVSFESVAYPGKYLALVDGRMITTKPASLSHCSFKITKYGVQEEEPEDINRKAAEKVILLINAIGKVNSTPSCENKINEARKAYQALTPGQRELISSEILQKLADAEKEYGRQKEEEAKKQAQVGTVSVLDTQKAVTSTNTDKKDAKGSTFKTLKAKAIGGNKSVTISWNKVKGASGYMVYGSQCGKKMKLLKTLPASKKSYKAAKLKKGAYYKYVVIAYKVIYKEKRTLAASVSVHAPTKSGKYKVPAGISISKSKYTLKKGKTLTLKPRIKLKGKGSFKSHIAKFRYESSDPKIATVTKKGKVKGIQRGKSCNIYIYTQNGLYKQVKVTIK